MRIKNIILLLITIIISNLSAKPGFPAEGMYPLSIIDHIELRKAGLKIPVSDIYNPGKTGLVDALVNIGGCTGSFVSAEGLVLTNHHCAYGAVVSHSTPEHNYLEDGFLAEAREDELPIDGQTCKITLSYEDVSEKILSEVEDMDDPAERTKKIDDIIEELEESAEDEENSIVAKVSEMFIGKTWVLFRYRIIKDVRLVYVPPATLGEFGGESDNWMWPRHNSDFAFMRAYTAPDGSAAEYSEDNVPYKPEKFLQVNSGGVKENDFVFILGYPGRTYRHRPSQFLEYMESYRLPYISRLYAWYIEELEKYAEGSEALQLEYANTIKRMSNVEKNYRGKLKGFRRLGLVEQKKAEEKKLAEFINSGNSLKDKYGTLLEEIKSEYDTFFDIINAQMWFRELYRFSDIFSSTGFILENADQAILPDDERKTKFKEDNIDDQKETVERDLNELNPYIEQLLLTRMFQDAVKFEGGSAIQAIANIPGSGDDHDDAKTYAEYIINHITPLDNNILIELLDMDPEEIGEIEDPVFNFAREIHIQKDSVNTLYKNTRGNLDKLLAKLVDVEMLMRKSDFVPDANSTLRLTYGYIKGYSPADAVYYSPITTLNGVIEKSYQGGDYELYEKVKEVYKNKDFGPFFDKKLGGVPACILYNTDTTGGNSGSPVLNAKGEIIGLNFDRAFEATINDFAWNDSYSRSIGVDIRYILWIASKVSNADHLLKEMNVGN